MAELNANLRIDCPERVVSRWVEAFNARDLEGMLGCLARDVALYPVRLSGLEACYRGHDGVRCWFAQLKRHRYAHTIGLGDVQDLGDGRALATGWLSLPEDPGLAPFCAVHRIVDGVTLSAHHYLTDPGMIEQLGLLSS